MSIPISERILSPNLFTTTCFNNDQESRNEPYGEKNGCETGLRQFSEHPVPLATPPTCLLPQGQALVPSQDPAEPAFSEPKSLMWLGCPPQCSCTASFDSSSRDLCLVLT